MTKESKSVAILFADITDSTKLYEMVGDVKARQLTSQSIAKITEITIKNSGRVIKTMGDGIMCTFPSADSAFGAAIEMQEFHDSHELSITAGFHYGQVIEEGGDVFGDAVNLAARVAGKAKSGETLLTEETVNLLSPQFRFTTRFLDSAHMKGKAEGINIYTVLNDGDDEATISLSSAPSNIGGTPTQEMVAKLKLRYNSQTLDLDSGTGYLIGRDPRCDLPVEAPYASRRHAVVGKQRERFILTDQSTNGTYVLPENGQEVFLKRESAQLVGRGIISLGEKPDTSSPTIIHYEYMLK